MKNMIWIIAPLLALAPGCLSDFDALTEGGAANGNGGSGGKPSDGSGASDSGAGGGTGATGGTGGSSATGGSGGSGSSGDEPVECNDGEKLCSDNSCVDSSLPEHGCGTETCEPCYSEGSHVLEPICDGEGKCANSGCQTGWLTCEGDPNICESSLSTPERCGSCTNSCPSGMASDFTCTESGQCRCSVAEACYKADVTSHAANVSCNTGNGRCRCGTSECRPGEYCRPSNSNPANARCTCDGSNPCGTNQTCCSGTCLILNTNSNCGGCGKACSSGRTCTLDSGSYKCCAPGVDCI
ncbi:MAG: hypothetical protein FWD57_02670 [Polyangiaceae bacterium]|nr:hypothetical protein [Polyangiaceae bacterium]